MILKPTTLEEQIEILKSRNLIIDGNAQSQLLHYGYYNLINGYKEPFLDKEQSQKLGKDYYITGTALSHLIELYEFDLFLRKNILYLISIVEIQVKSTISLYFSLRYGSSHWDYLTPSSFTTIPSKRKYVHSLITQLQQTIGNFQNHKPHPVICHYMEKYNTVPLWALNTVMTFGTMSKFYDNLTDDIKKKIAKRINSALTPKQLSSFLYFLTNIRNKCAHGNRLYSHRNDHVRNKRAALIPELSLHRHISIPYDTKIHQYVHGQNDILAVLLIFSLILPPDSKLPSIILALDSSISHLDTKVSATIGDYVQNITGCSHKVLYSLHDFLSAQIKDGKAI